MKQRIAKIALSIEITAVAVIILRFGQSGRPFWRFVLLGDGEFLLLPLLLALFFCAHATRGWLSKPKKPWLLLVRHLLTAGFLYVLTAGAFLFLVWGGSNFVKEKHMAGQRVFIYWQEGPFGSPDAQCDESVFTAYKKIPLLPIGIIDSSWHGCLTDQ